MRIADGFSDDNIKVNRNFQFKYFEIVYYQLFCMEQDLLEAEQYLMDIGNIAWH